MTCNKQEDEDKPSLAIASTTCNFREKGCSWPQHTLSWPATEQIKFSMSYFKHPLLKSHLRTTMAPQPHDIYLHDGRVGKE